MAQSLQFRNKLSVKERFEDDFHFEGIKIKQSLETEPPSCVYDAAIVMAQYLERKGELTGARLLELGAGCGFTGVYLAQKVKLQKVLMTDVDSVVPLIRENIELNGL